MGVLYDMRVQIDKHVEKNGLDLFKVRGKITLDCGFMLGLVKPTTPDNPAEIEKLKKAAKAVLNLNL